MIRAQGPVQQDDGTGLEMKREGSMHLVPLPGLFAVDGAQFLILTDTQPGKRDRQPREIGDVIQTLVNR